MLSRQGFLLTRRIDENRVTLLPCIQPVITVDLVLIVEIRQALGELQQPVRITVTQKVCQGGKLWSSKLGG